MAITIFTIAALATGGIFGKYYAMFGRNTATIQATRLANELIGRFQTRWAQDYSSIPPDCGVPGVDDATTLNKGPFCYQIDLFRDTTIGQEANLSLLPTLSDLEKSALPNDRNTVRQLRQVLRLRDYTVWMDVSSVRRKNFITKASPGSDWLRAKMVRIRVLRATDVFCGISLAEELDALGLPTRLHLDPSGFVGDYFASPGTLQATVNEGHYKAGTTPKDCLIRDEPVGTTPTPIPVTEASTLLVLNPRAVVSRRGSEYVTYKIQEVYEPTEAVKTGNKYRPRRLSSADSDSTLTYFDPEEGKQGSEVTVDFYKTAYPGILHVPPTGWVPDRVTGAVTFDPVSRNNPDGTATLPDPTIRYTLWTFSDPAIESILRPLHQFRHRLVISTFTDRIVRAGARPGFLAALPQAAGRATDNYIPLWISVTSLPDDDGKCVDELAGGPVPPSPKPCSREIAGYNGNAFTRIVVPTFPSTSGLPYEASINIPPGPPPIRLATVAQPDDALTQMGLPYLYGLPGVIRKKADENNPVIRKLASNTAATFGRPHLVHITLPRSFLSQWKEPDGTDHSLNLSIARVRFQS